MQKNLKSLIGVRYSTFKKKDDKRKPCSGFIIFVLLIYESPTEIPFL